MKAKFSLDGRRRREAVEPEPRALPIKPGRRISTRFTDYQRRVLAGAWIGLAVISVAFIVFIVGSDQGWFEPRAEPSLLDTYGDADTNAIITDSDESIFTYPASEPVDFSYRSSIPVVSSVGYLPANCTAGRLYVVRDGRDNSDCSIGTGNKQVLCMCDKGGRSYSAMAMADE